MLCSLFHLYTVSSPLFPLLAAFLLDLDICLTLSGSFSYKFWNITVFFFLFKNTHTHILMIISGIIFPLFFWKFSHQLWPSPSRVGSVSAIKASFNGAWELDTSPLPPPPFSFVILNVLSVGRLNRVLTVTAFSTHDKIFVFQPFSSMEPSFN